MNSPDEYDIYVNDGEIYQSEQYGSVLQELDSKIEIGNVVSWNHEGVEYCSKVLSRDDSGDLCVQVVYDNYGMTQDKIEITKITGLYQ